ncbi:ATP-dependent DNA helicase PIF1 [Prunus yedoensis var. nudiflora]|uniref:ATP-dependent DNA helicase n=1 Tax=Prunus yedoensis var. nudiflora TaxID=2094558 RepID=A0A314Z6G5_PRUYE|nr:ATP-dependent DNA helicase PIF1 [Prunus yedoensis var. nudiflora]
MLGMKFFGCAFSAHRNFSTKITGKNTKWAQGKYKSGYKAREGEAKNTKTRERVQWTDQQKQVMSAISEGKSVFITGSAGTGKTILVKHIIKQLKKRHGPSKVFVTAPTGVAACTISGQTLHSFAGNSKNNKAYKRWRKAEALVLDEISMVDAELFESLDFIAEPLSKSMKFGLPPVKPQQNSGGKQFAFEAECWDSSFDLQVNLTKVFRQSDPQLIKLLQGIRTGESDPEDLNVLEQSCSKAKPDPTVVQLYPRNEDVNRVNSSRLASLGNELVVYTAVDSGEDSLKRQLEQGIAPKEIALCKDARVMLVKNLNTWRGLVNGATGTVTGFYESKDVGVTRICDDGLLPVVRFDSGLEMTIEPIHGLQMREIQSLKESSYLSYWHGLQAFTSVRA